MSLIKWPTEGWWKDWFLIARIDSSESPSKIELCKPFSWRKLTALRAASVSRATMEDGKGMISDIVASTSPKEFRITTPMPAAPSSSKMAPSKFVFTVLESGGFQMTFFCGCFKMGLAWRRWYSWRYCCAKSVVFSKGATGSLTRILFRLHQINQQIVINASDPWGFRRDNLKTSANVRKEVVAACKSVKSVPQAGLIFSQPYSAWDTVSGSLLQLEQIGVCTTLRFTKFSIVGRESIQALHAKVLILFGTFNLHRPTQNFLFSPDSEAEAASTISISQISWYPVLTEYFPSFVFGQMSISSWGVKQIGIDLILCASKGRKQKSMSCIFHQPELQSMRSATRASVGRTETKEMTFPGPSLGS